MLYVGLLSLDAQVWVGCLFGFVSFLRGGLGFFFFVIVLWLKAYCFEKPVFW